MIFVAGELTALVRISASYTAITGDDFKLGMIPYVPTGCFNVFS